MKRGRDKLAARRRALGHTQESLAEILDVAVSTVARWEQGVGCPLPALRRPLADALSISLDGLDRVLSGNCNLESGPTLLAGEPRVVTGEVDNARVSSSSSGIGHDERPRIRHAAWEHADPFDPPGYGKGEDLRTTPSQVPLTDWSVKGQAAYVHRCYQAAEYRQATRFLAPLMRSVDALVAESSAPDRRAALKLQCSVAIAAAKLATRAGDASQARLAAEHAASAAFEAADPFGQAAAAYQLACAFLKAGRTEQAELLALEAADAVRDTGPQGMTWRGSLMLISAIIAARRHDSVEAADRLDLAAQLAERLGIDGNLGWTAFGPTNVRIHRMSAAVALDDPTATLAVADQVDVIAIPPGLRGRQAQFHLDSAWAHIQLNQEPLALIHLLDAERVAPQIVYRDGRVHGLIQDMLASEHRLRVPSLRGLARRAGVQR